MSPVRVSYYSDVLCIWAYAAQRRLEQLVQKFGDEISIDARFCSVFPDAWVESRRGAVAWAVSASPRFPSPLIKPDVRISRIRLSDRLHLEAHGRGPRWTLRMERTARSPNTLSVEKRRVPREGTLWRLTRKRRTRWST